MKKIHWGAVLAGVAVGLAALILTAMGNPANMGFCIACFLRDTAGACGLHSAAKVQYVRPEIIGLVLGAFLMSVAGKEFKARAGSSPALRFVIGAFVVIGALAFLGCPLRMVLRLGGGDLNALVGLIGFFIGILIGIACLKRGFTLKRSYEVSASEGSVLLRSNLQSNITAGSVKLTGCTLIGDITANGPVTVSEDSKVTGNITAQSLLCAGEINGDIRISGNTQMDANARVSGSVVTGTISVAAGAVLNGSVEMKGTMEAKS